MINKLPIFPLNTVLFPGMPLHLHIFENRYKLMMQQILLHEPVFGVALIRRGNESLGAVPEPHLVGTTARVTHVEPLEDGRMNISAIGEKRIQIEEQYHDYPYLIADVQEYNVDFHRPLDIYRRLRTLRKQVEYYLRTLDRMDTMEIDLSQIDMPDDPLTFLFLSASLLQIPSPEKQPILTAPSALEICLAVERLYRRENAVLRDLLPISADHARNLAMWN
jgi:Lon protease-like protein